MVCNNLEIFPLVLLPQPNTVSSAYPKLTCTGCYQNAQASSYHSCPQITSLAKNPRAHSLPSPVPNLQFPAAYPTPRVTGQNGSGQNGTDKMVWTNWYTDKMVLDKMSWTQWRNPPLVNSGQWTGCPLDWTGCPALRMIKHFMQHFFTEI